MESIFTSNFIHVIRDPVGDNNNSIANCIFYFIKNKESTCSWFIFRAESCRWKKQC